MVVFNKRVGRWLCILPFTMLLLWARAFPAALENVDASADEISHTAGGLSSLTKDAVDEAWRNFRYALGTPSLIGAGADHPLADDLWRPIPAVADDEIDEQKFRLGFQLFHEGRLSSADSVACISCHAGPQSGVDGLRFSRGVNRTLGHFNSLSLFNAAFQFRQFWDGRAVTMQDQALEPIVNEVEMGNTLEAVQAMLEEDAQYSAHFAALYPDGVTLNNMVDALTHFQRINFTRPDSAFIHYLQGEPDQLSAQALRGKQRFQDVGCSNCHNGISLGGNSYQELGVLIPYYGDQRPAGVHDEGVYRRTGRSHDLHVFKVPGLHTVAATAPYFHDGSVATLESAIAVMAEHQLAIILSDEDIADIAAFLRALLPYGAPLAVDMSTNQTHAPQNLQNGSSVESRSDQHRVAYKAALIEIDQIFTNLLAEVERIDKDEVAHFDFLQFQHLELIRHSRALRFPPADLDITMQATLSEEAEKLLAEVNNLEWVIADLLRGHVMMRALGAMDDELRDTRRAPLLPDSSLKYQEYQRLTRQAKEHLDRSDVRQLSSTLRDLSDRSLNR